MTSVSLEKSLKRIPKNLRSVEGLTAYTDMLKSFALPLAKKNEKLQRKYAKKSGKKTSKKTDKSVPKVVHKRAKKAKVHDVIPPTAHEKQVDGVIALPPVVETQGRSPTVIEKEETVVAIPAAVIKGRAKSTKSAAELKAQRMASLAKARAAKEAKKVAKA